MNVISLAAARTRMRPRTPVQPPVVLGGPIPHSQRANAVDVAEDRIRMRQNLAALAVVVCIIVLGAWVIDGLRTYSRVLMCAEAGHRNCLPAEHR